MSETGNLARAIEQTTRLLEKRPDLAEEQANEILKVIPGQPHALLLLAQARRALGNDEGARAVLAPLAKAHPNAAYVHYELGEVLGALGETRAAIDALGRATALDAKNAPAWRALGDQLTLAGDGAAADRAYAHNIKASAHDPRLVEAATALCDNDLPVAEKMLRDFLKEHPTDVAAIRMLAEVGARLGVYADSEKLLSRALELSPSFTAARHNYAMVLHRQLKTEAALEQIDILLKGDPRNPGYRALRAAALVRIGEFLPAIEVYESLLKEQPVLPKGWMSYGHSLKTVGRRDESIAAYRKAISQEPSLGEAYWSMANLKTFRFTPQEVEAMRVQLARGDIEDEDRFHLQFALGKALEDARDYEASFASYAEANALRKKSLRYDPDITTTHLRRSKAVFTPQFLKSREGAGCPSAEPIFVVSLPRSGSTLIEQILSSHSMIEGTMELPDITALAYGLDARRTRRRDTEYPDILERLEPERLRELGEEYLERARVQRKSGKPFFVDKMPNNFLHLGFMHLILPNARIIDARRHPLGCCLSNFKQHFARGQPFSYDLDELGRYWRDYAELMAHYDKVLPPGRVHRVLYEEMVADPEREIRRLLDHCGLPFEESCLNFHETDRAVRTASSEQVRQPIFTEGVEQWRNYEKWLAPLKTALGPVLETYPAVPDFDDESTTSRVD